MGYESELSLRGSLFPFAFSFRLPDLDFFSDISFFPFFFSMFFFLLLSERLRLRHMRGKNERGRSAPGSVCRDSPSEP